MIDYINSNLYLTDGINKQLVITYGNDCVITNDKIHYEQFTLTESICAESQLRFGGCEASMLEFRVTSTVESLRGKWLTVAQVLNNDYDNPFIIGHYKVDSDKLTADKKHRDIVAYDAMYYLVNTEVSEWYNGLVFPFTLGNFRKRLFEYLEFEQQEIDLPNDSALIRATPYQDELFAGDLLKDICELNGCFGRVSRDNIFEYIFLNDTSSIYKITPNKYTKSNFQYDDFVTENIDGIVLGQSNSDIQLYFMVGENPYVLNTRAIYLGENLDVLNDIANNLYNIIFDVKYIPFSIDCIGNPCVECGDKINIIANDEIISTYLLERKLKGIQSLKDNYSAQGMEYYEEVQSVRNSQMQSIKNDMSRNNFYSYTFTNAVEYIIDQTDKTIIQFNVSATSDTDAIFVATIPIITDFDGELVLNYFVDAVKVETDELRQYLHAGNNFVTISNYFKMGENARFTLLVNARIEYIESTERQHAAKIISLENYIKNGVYKETQIDTTLPNGIINAESIKSVLFAKGLATGNEWDGTINIAETYKPISYSNDVSVANMINIFEIDIQIPDGAEIIDTYNPIMLNNAINLVPLYGRQAIGKVINYLFIKPEYEEYYEYSREYVSIEIDNNLTFNPDYKFMLATKYVYHSTELDVDRGTMSSILVRTDDKEKLIGVEFR